MSSSEDTTTQKTYTTTWYVSIIANVCAVSISTLLSILYSNSAFKNKKNTFWHVCVVIILFLSSSFLTYYLIYLFFGYVPMGKINDSIFDV